MSSAVSGRGLAWAVVVVALCTALGAAMQRAFEPATLIMLYLAGVVYTAYRWGRSAALLGVVLSVAAFDFVFVPPFGSFKPADPQYFLTFGVMLAVGLLIGHLVALARRQARLVHEREQRAQALAAEAETERLRNTLLSGISHDFRTPLTTIIGAATSLIAHGTTLDEPRRALLVHSILDEARRMHALTSDLLDLTRMEEGAVRPHCEWCPADELVEEARQALGARAGTHRVRARVDARAVVWCDARLVEQALVNLLDNALRYTPAGSEIVVAIEVDASEWRLVVSDDGPGLPPGHEGDVFKKFFRGRHEPAGAGTGLGLAICAAVARLHGGDVAATGNGARGARFTLTLPQPPVPARMLEEAA